MEERKRMGGVGWRKRDAFDFLSELMEVRIVTLRLEFMLGHGDESRILSAKVRHALRDAIYSPDRPMALALAFTALVNNVDRDYIDKPDSLITERALEFFDNNRDLFAEVVLTI